MKHTRHRSAGPRKRRKTEKVLLDDFHVEVYVPSHLSAGKARDIRKLTGHVLRAAARLIEAIAPMSTHTNRGEVVVRVGDRTA